MEIGSSVQVKEGVVSPDYDDLEIGGWQGRVTKINDNIVTLELDSITLTKLSKDYIIDSIMEDVEFSLIMLKKDELTVVEPRDKPSDSVRVRTNIERRFSVGDEENRISEILKATDESVNKENLTKFFKHLKKNLPKGSLVTGVEDFSWEEPYVFGKWDENEYEELKITNPSYTDHFKLIKLIDKFEGRQGIMVEVERISDKKKFELPLWDLELVDEEAPEFLLITDYSSWMTNY